MNIGNNRLKHQYMMIIHYLKGEKNVKNINRL